MELRGEEGRRRGGAEEVRKRGEKVRMAEERRGRGVEEEVKERRSGGEEGRKQGGGEERKRGGKEERWRGRDFEERIRGDE